MASLFDARVRPGWRSPDPPPATAGVIWRAVREDANTDSSPITNLAEGVRMPIPRHYASADGVTISHLSFTTSRNRVSLTTDGGELARFADLGLVFRSGSRTLSLRVPTNDVRSPYGWTFGDEVDEFKEAAHGKTVEVVLVDHSVRNILLDSAEVINPEPEYVPLVPVVEPVSMWHPACVQDTGITLMRRKVFCGVIRGAESWISLTDTRRSLTPRMPAWNGLSRGFLRSTREARTMRMSSVST